MRKAVLGIFILFPFLLIGQTTSSGSGDWNAGGSWDTNVTPPDNGDTVYIEAGDIITVNVNTTYTTSLVIIVRGTLKLDATMVLPAGSMIFVEPGGTVTSGNNGFRLDIGDQTWGGLKNTPIISGVITDLVLKVKEVNLDVQFLNSDELYISWNIEKSKDELIKLELERSYDGINYETTETFYLELSGHKQINYNFDSKYAYFRMKVYDVKDVTYSKVKQVNNKEFMLNVYPNPFTDKVSVANNFNNDDMKFRVVDILGNVVLEETDDSHISTMDLDSGLYFVHIYQNNQLVFNQRMLKK